MNKNEKLGAEAKTTELRCDCGSLLARRIGNTLELKCRRCKRVIGIAKIIFTDSKGCCGKP